MKRELTGNIVLDTTPLLELIYSTIGGIKLKEALKAERLQANITEVTLTELRYILCRKLGLNETRKRIKTLLESGYLSVHETSKLIEAAAEYKYKRALSLADCFAISLAKAIDAPILFSKKEDDLVKEMSRETFDVKIFFLEEPAQNE